MRPDIIALVGAPNSGKTSLYNWLTNSKFKTVNYPGATVEYARADLATQWGEPCTVLDTPGTYSLYPKSLDEEVTVAVLRGDRIEEKVSKIVVVVDGTQLARHLTLVDQVKKMGFPFVIAITMEDLLIRSGVNLDVNLLQAEFGAPVVLINGILGRGIDHLVQACRALPMAQSIKDLPPASPEHNEILRNKFEALAGQVLGEKKKLHQISARTEKWDQLLLHPVLGSLFFLLIMTALFSSIFWLASPLMDMVDSGFSWLVDFILQGREQNLFAQFLAQGIVGTFGAVLVFVPQIFILFLGVGTLESTGYLARAATIIDRPLSYVGLSGRSFVPLLSGFACAVPAMMATRNINSARERWIANAVIPLMTCSARLPVYSLLLSFLFFDQPAWKAGLSLALIYIFSLVLGGIAAGILNKLVKTKERSVFMLELPIYRRPIGSVLLHQSVTRTSSYVKRAGPAIFVFGVLIWLGTTFPNFKAEPGPRLDSSYLATAGRLIEPVFAPMGVDWRVGVGLMSAFAAREVFVSAMALVFSVTGEGDSQTEGLLKVMGEAKLPNGTPVFTLASTLGIIVFFMIALQCMSTVVIAARENNSIKFAITQLVVLNVVGYAASVLVVQGLRLMGVA